MRLPGWSWPKGTRATPATLGNQHMHAGRVHALPGMQRWNPTLCRSSSMPPPLVHSARVVSRMLARRRGSSRASSPSGSCRSHKLINQLCLRRSARVASQPHARRRKRASTRVCSPSRSRYSHQCAHISSHSATHCSRVLQKCGNVCSNFQLGSWCHNCPQSTHRPEQSTCSLRACSCTSPMQLRRAHVHALTSMRG